MMGTLKEPPAWSQIRRRELDWLRVLAFGLLILYHVGQLYVENWGWHYKSNYQSEFLQNIMLWSNQWRMSLLFLVSGVAVAYLLERMSWLQFWVSRHTRLLLPLLFGMAVVVVPQVYVEMSAGGHLDGINYMQFWLAYLDQGSELFTEFKTVGDWHVTWNHLWYLMYVFVYSLVLAIVSPLLRLPSVTAFCARLASRVQPWSLVVGPVCLFFIYSYWVRAEHPPSNNFVDDWFNHCQYLTVFVLGFVLVKSSRLWSAIGALRWFVTVAALLTYAGIIYYHNGGRFGDGTVGSVLAHLVWSANGWLWVLAVIAWAQRHLNVDHPAMQYMNRGVYCFYILHQTIIVLLAFWLVPRNLGPVLEPLLVISLTAAACLLGYELLRRLPMVPMLFGIGDKAQIHLGQARESAVTSRRFARSLPGAAYSH